MKSIILLAAIMLFCLPLTGNAQNVKTKTKPKWITVQHYTMEQAVYFPDYRTFYDPGKGYYYYDNSKWISSETPPAYLNDVDLGAARMEYIEERTFDPVKNYMKYGKMYPVQKVYPGVPTPPLQ